MILVSHENVKKCVLGGCTAQLPQRLKSTCFEIFSSLHSIPFERISKNVDFSLWSKQCIVQRKWDQNCENHTHSEMAIYRRPGGSVRCFHKNQIHRIHQTMIFWYLRNRLEVVTTWWSNRIAFCAPQKFWFWFTYLVEYYM